MKKHEGKVRKNCFKLFISGPRCLTTNNSPDKNAVCKFPWKFNGKLLNECTNEQDPDGE